jgi:multiple sugar transport system permease protein
VPYELVEAARIDGLGRFGTYWRVALPLCRNGLLAVGILTFILAWGNYVWPLVVASDPSKYPVSVAVAGYFASRSHQTTNVIMAAALLASVPLIVIYSILQRWIVDSIAHAGIRG